MQWMVGCLQGTLGGGVCLQPERAGESELVVMVTLKGRTLPLLLLPERDGKQQQ